MIKTRLKLIQAYLKFFSSKKHKVIPNSPLVPEHDPTVLFTTAGMHPLVPFILGEKHPQGKKLVNIQKCIRTGDIESVGDETHLTFFEMLGNWSLGDYWKAEAINYSYEFLTKVLKLNPKNLHVTVFAGDKEVVRDNESSQIWKQLGISKERIHFLGREHNFWGPAGKYGPCGPCTEMFLDTGKKKCSKACHPGDCSKYIEIWNDVFMEYNKTEQGYEKLRQKNVDTGMGVERTIAMLQCKGIYETEVFLPLIKLIKELSKIKNLTAEQMKSARIIADHIKAASFILAEDIFPSNVDRGYVLRRLIRKSVRHGRLLGINENFTSFTSKVARAVVGIYKQDYPHLKNKEKMIFSELEKEEEKFRRTLEKGIKKFESILIGKPKIISGKDAFDLYQSYGFPLEMTSELAGEQKMKVDTEGFNKLLREHQELSRKGAEQKFKGGLADARRETTKLHTVTHLLHQSLRDVLGKHVQQKGSNITAERLRFDFSHTKKMTAEEIKKVEDIVNKKIKEALPVTRKEMTLKDALKQGALAFFGEKYGEKVHVYSIGKYSKEVCGGPHVENTKELGRFKIVKEEAVAAGIRRIKALLK